MKTIYAVQFTTNCTAQVVFREEGKEDVAEDILDSRVQIHLNGKLQTPGSVMSAVAGPKGRIRPAAPDGRGVGEIVHGNVEITIGPDVQIPPAHQS